MHLDYALEGYWLSKRRGFSPHTVADYEVTFRRLLAFIGAEREFEKITTADVKGPSIWDLTKHARWMYNKIYLIYRSSEAFGAICSRMITPQRRP